MGRVVLLSSGAAPGGNLTNAVARYHIASERAVRDSGLAWTFLQPNSFMTNTFEWIAQLRKGDLVRAPFADVDVATIDPADIAAVAARALLPHLPGPPVEFDRRGLRLSGPEALRPADRVRLLGAALGRDLRFQPIPDEEARREMKMSATMPAEYVDAFFSFFVDGTLDETTVHPTVGEVLGRPPTRSPGGSPSTSTGSDDRAWRGITTLASERIRALGSWHAGPLSQHEDL